MHKNIKDLTGKIFGKLTVVEYRSTNKHRATEWLCSCTCGNSVIVASTRLVSGNTKSCGCLNLDSIRLPFGEASLNKILYNYTKRAKDKGITFSLSKEEFVRLISLDCFYCGERPHYFREQKTYGGTYYNGLDRIDNSRGYEIDNVVPCCKDCNYAKNKMSYQRFKDWIFKISDHMTSKRILQSR